MRNGMAVNPIWSTSKFLVVLLMYTSQTVTERCWMIKLKSFDMLGKNPKGYRLYNEQANKVMTRQDVILDESNFLLSTEPKKPDESLEILIVPTKSANTVEKETGSQGPESHDNTVPEQQVRRSD